MDKHIHLTFLSDVKVNKGKVSSSEFKNIGENNKVEITNESAIKYLITKGFNDKSVTLDKIFVFASKKIRGNIQYNAADRNEPPRWEDYVDDENKKWTHLDYFKKRISMIDNLTAEGIDKDDLVVAIEYDEDLPLQMKKQSNDELSIRSSQGAIVEMADAILRYYIDNCEDENGNISNIILHADLTGGLRNANMMMLAVMRILQYSGILAGRIMYADYSRKMVDDSDEIYKMFDLVAGADEFAQFGSVSALFRYYNCDIDRKPKGMSDELFDLLKAMHSFADEVKVCHYGAFKKAIENLRKSLEKFHDKTNTDMNYQDRFMWTLQGKILKDYQDLIHTELDDVKLIQWCVNHDYMQQALTLYTERVPELVFDKNLIEVRDSFYDEVATGIYDNDQEVAEEPQKGSKKDLRSINFKIFSVCEEKNIENKLNAAIDKKRQEYNKFIKENVTKLIRGKEYVDIEDFKQKLSETRFIINDERLLDSSWSTIKIISKDRNVLKDSNDPMLVGLINECKKWYIISQKKKGDTRQDEEIWLEEYEKQYVGIRKKILAQFMDTLNGKLIGKLFSTIDYEKGYRESHFLITNIDKGNIKCNIDKKLLAEIKRIYQIIKIERNSSNHARVDSKMGQVDKVNEWLQDGIKTLDEAMKSLRKG